MFDEGGATQRNFTRAASNELNLGVSSMIISGGQWRCGGGVGCSWLRSAKPNRRLGAPVCKRTRSAFRIPHGKLLEAKGLG